MTHDGPTGRSASSGLSIDAKALWARYQAERDKRLRPDGSGQYFTPTGRFAHYLDDPYVDDAPARLG